jgi:hypothetical protein
VHILFLAANNSGDAPLALEQEVYGVQRRIGLLNGAGGVRMSVYPKLDIADLQTILEDARADILHIAAHADLGDFRLPASRISGEAEDIVQLSAAQLADHLHALRLRFRLIVLNGCKTASMRPLLRVADMVIGHELEVSNVAAAQMAAALYEALATGATVDQAFRRALVQLRTFSHGRGKPKLLCAPGVDAKRARLSEPLRLIARLPKLDAWLERKRTPPPRLIKNGFVECELGVAGAPSSAHQLVLFTDDKSFISSETKLEENLSWIVRDTPASGVMWTDDPFSVNGDCRWYAATATTAGEVVSCAGTLDDALRRFYVDEEWRLTLPADYAARVDEVLAFLRSGDGTRRLIARRTGAAAGSGRQTLAAKNADS